MADLYKNGVKTPLDFGVWGDRKNPRINALYMVQNGLGLPDRENYLEDNERNQKLHQAYLSYLEKMLTYAGHKQPADAAKAIYALEKAMAEHSWTQVDSRNTDKNYNKMTPQALAEMAPGFDWSAFLSAANYDVAKEIIVYQPSFMTGFAQLMADTDLATWKDYFSARLIISSASFMNAEVYDVHFDFYSRTLYGAEEPRPRWKRAIGALNRRIGESVGKVFVKQYFPPQAKSKMDELVANLLLAMDHRINNLAWMSDETKVEAHDKLVKISPQIGYPNKWRDYSSITISKDSLLQNIRSTNQYTHADSVSEIGNEPDKELWWYAPQTVNASYSPTENRIVFPAGYLQAPNFQIGVDDAANYGAIGVTIGHEIGHGFDDEGSKNDGDGVLRNWWTTGDREKFKARTEKLVAQFNKFCPFDDACLNGELSLGENIGDLAGLVVAYDAYQLSLKGKEAPVIDGLTGDERFMLSFAQAGKGKWRDDFVRTLIVTDPHVPDMYRVLGPLQNFDLFYKTYDVKEGDGMYLPPEERVNIW
jgi:predicted metalloendopeptidase